MYAPQTQTDSDEVRDARSLATGIAFDPSSDPTRQEFAEESDINFLIRRYGRIPDTGMAVRFGEQLSFDMDLMTAFEAMSNARASYDQLPDHVRAKYPTIESLMAGLESGELSLAMPNPGSEAPAGKQEPQSPAPAGAPPANPPA